MPSTISAGTTAGTAIAIAGDTTGNLAFQTNGTTTAMTIDTSQNVGIGTTSPIVQLHLSKSGTSDYTAIRLTNSGTSGRTFEIGVGGNSTPSDYANRLFVYDSTAGANRMVIDSSGNLLFNSGYGSAATAYGCRAWVNFKGTDTVSIRASGNVSSITDVATGTYWVNFTNSMPDINYCVQGNRNWRGVFNSDNWETGRVYMISADTNNNVQADALFCFVSIYR